jgi:hypothetical protein
VIEHDDGRPILVMVRPGFMDFTAKVKELAPRANVKVSAFARLVSRISR